MGCTACNLKISDPISIYMFLSLYLWQIAHFMAICFKCKKEYEGAGYKMLSIEDKEMANPLLEICGLKLANGVPTMVGGPNDIQTFPMQGDQVWTLENVPDHPIYKNDMQLMRELLDKESKEIDSILDIRNN